MKLPTPTSLLRRGPGAGTPIDPARREDTPESPFPYDGPPALRQPIVEALSRVIDPEVALNIVDVGLVYRVTVDAQALHVRLTMTSAACPVGDLIVEEAQAELAGAVPAGLAIRIELVWEPPWTPERLSASARRFMGW